MGKDEVDVTVSEFYLMHKDTTVVQMNISSSGKPHHISFNKKHNPHIPLGAQLNMVRFHEWWEDRAVPRTRQGAKSALKKLGYASTGKMLIDNLALSLTDCYWIKPRIADITWRDINLFENHFVDYFGEITINSNADVGKRSKFSLATSQGEVRKKWVIRSDGRRAMVKGNWADSYQQSINEAFASLIHYKQGVIPYTNYELLPLETTYDDKGLGCICDLYTSNEAEFVPAWEILQNTPMRNHDNYYLHFKNQCIRYGMDEEYFERFMSYEILTDMLMTNTDRHMNNIGILRNPDTLAWIGFAPIYDTGNSMFFRNVDLSNINLYDIKVTSFSDREKKLLRFVRYPKIVDLDKLPTKDEFISYYEKDIPDRHVRIDAMWNLFQKKRDMVYEFQKETA